eukprot:scaffold80252_cov28-Prasinocladus_malaysianus.AAC.1
MQDFRLQRECMKASEAMDCMLCPQPARGLQLLTIRYAAATGKSHVVQVGLAETNAGESICPHLCQERHQLPGQPCDPRHGRLQIRAAAACTEWLRTRKEEATNKQRRSSRSADSTSITANRKGQAEIIYLSQFWISLSHSLPCHSLQLLFA